MGHFRQQLAPRPVGWGEEIAEVSALEEVLEHWFIGAEEHHHATGEAARAELAALRARVAELEKIEAAGKARTCATCQFWSEIIRGRPGRMSCHNAGIPVTNVDFPEIQGCIHHLAKPTP